jgi:hypothetical protein
MRPSIALARAIAGPALTFTVKRQMTRRLLRTLVPGCWLLFFAAQTGCVGGVDRVTGTPAFSGGGAVSQTGGRDPALVGGWRRITFFQDDEGVFHSSELIWEFNADGGARRIIITSNFSLGVTVTDVAQGIWRTSRGVVDVTLLSPTSSSLRFQYSVGPSQLRLGLLTLERIS